jgi:heat shock protein HslJ
MRAWLIRITVLLAVMVIAVACSGSTASPAATASASAAAGGGGELTGKTWQWTGSTLSGNTTVPDPAKYTIEFGTDGNFASTVDCNQVSGTYKTTDSGEITIEPGPSTLAACPPGSLADIYVAGLMGATNYAFAGGNLVLTTTDGTMTFS